MKIFFKIIILFITLGFCGKLYSQNNPPKPPELISASVEPETNPLVIALTWKPSPTTNVVKYKIFEYENNAGKEIDEVDGYNTTYYEYEINISDYKPISFCLAAIDVFGEISQLTDPAQTTMLLKYAYEKCDLEITLDWTEYLGWNGGVSKYNIYRREEGTGVSYELLDEVSNETFQYIDKNIFANSTYHYYIEAISNNEYRSLSNSVKISTYSIIPPSYMNVDNVIVENNFINVKFSVDKEADDVVEYLIQRAVGSKEAEFNTIGKVTNEFQEEIIYTDRLVNVHELKYYYRIVSINSCGHETYRSEASSNILLNTFNSGVDLHHALEWTEYETWKDGIAGYKVYGYFDGKAYFIDDVNYTSNKYTNNIESYVLDWYKKEMFVTNEFCYYIEAYENMKPASLEDPNISISNMSCVYEYPEIWVPNAFNVTSFVETNRKFRPVVNFIKKDSYSFKVYNRYGIPVFNTKNIYEGWDGRLKENFAPSQQYIYNIRYSDHEGKEYNDSGLFYLFIE